MLLSWSVDEREGHEKHYELFYEGSVYIRLSLLLSYLGVLFCLPSEFPCDIITLSDRIVKNETGARLAQQAN